MKNDPIQTSRLIRTTRGQLDGLLKMVEEDRYCIDIAHQISATQSILNRVKVDLLTAHIDHCVKESIQVQDQEDLGVKLEEIKTIVRQLAKNWSLVGYFLIWRQIKSKVKIKRKSLRALLV